MCTILLRKGAEFSRLEVSTQLREDDTKESTHFEEVLKYSICATVWHKTPGIAEQ